MSSRTKRPEHFDADAAGNHTAPPPKRSKSTVGGPTSQGASTSQQPFLSQHTEQLASNNRAVPSAPTPRNLNRERENGALLHIKMQNFKSHGNFEMSFGPRLNFVVGRNGTGKSSILAAVIAALGGNPNKHSNNAGGQKAGSGLVRDGSSWASVQLEIANGGPDPFYLDDDGSPPAPKLVISLRLNKNEATGRTTSAYSINGHATPLKKVRELAEFYNYEVENPCVVNTQAVSASFLRDPKDAAKRYQFFLRAANLEPLKNDYKAAYKEKATVEERLARHGEQREFLAEQLVLAQRRANAASERLELERGIEQAARRSAYAILNSAKSGLALTREGFTSLKDKAEALGKEEAAAKEALRHARNDAEKLIQSRKNLTVKLSEHSRKASDLKKEWKAATRKVKDEEGRMNDAIDEQKEQRKAISELERSINEQRKGLDAATRKAEAALNAKIDKLNAGNEAVKREKAEMERSLTPLEEAVQSAQQASAISRRASADAKKDQSEAHAEAARLTKAASASNAQDGKAALFHRDMPALLHAISNAPAGTWKAYQPVGPLGMHLSARPEFVRAFGAGSDAAIEKACGGWPNLVSFTVGCHADEGKLRELFSAGLRGLKINVQPWSDKEGRFTPTAPPRTRPIDQRGEACPTVLEALQPIENSIAFNALLNSCQPEGCLLLKSFDDVARIVFPHDTPWKSHYSRAFTPDGTSHFRRGKTTASEPSMSRRGGPSLLCASNGADDRAMLAEQAARQKEAAKAADEVVKTAAEREKADALKEKSAVQQHQTAANKLRALDQKLHNASGDLEAARDERATNNPAIVLNDSRAEVEGEKRKLSEAVEREAQHKAEAARLNSVVSAIVAKLQEVQAEEAAMSSQMDSKENENANNGESSSGGGDLQLKAEAEKRASAAADKARQAVYTKEEECKRLEQAVKEKEAAVREQFPEGPPGDLAMIDSMMSGGGGEEEEGEAEDGGGKRRRKGLSERAAGKQPVGRNNDDSTASSRPPKPSAGLAAYDKWAKEEEEKAKKHLNALDSKLRLANRKCGGAHKDGASAEQLKADETKAASDLVAHDAMAVQCQALFEKLGPALQERVNYWKDALRKAASQSSADFNRCLSYKNLAGRLEHDRKAETLDAFVYTSSQDANAHASRSLRTLSGGEQAFAALSFSLAMWPFSASPLRAMDEFDKNMDQTFLQASLKHLLEACEAAPTRQILILTPNDYHASLTGGVCKPLFDRLMGASKTDDYDAAVQIKHMPEVERG